MTTQPTHALHPDVQLRILRDMPPLPPTVEAAIDRHWAVATRRRPLFNGRIFSVDAISPAYIDGHWSEYRRLTAQFAEPDLSATLGIRSLAVCGALCSPDGLVVGRREPNAAYQPGLWQLPPAGSVDQHAATQGGADWRVAVLRELHEELGLAPADLGALRPLCLVQHPSGVLDLGIRIDTPLDRATILARHEACGDKEYDRLMVVPPQRLEAEVQARDGALVPSAAVFRDHVIRMPR